MAEKLTKTPKIETPEPVDFNIQPFEAGKLRQYPWYSIGVNPFLHPMALCKADTDKSYRSFLGTMTRGWRNNEPLTIVADVTRVRHPADPEYVPRGCKAGEPVVIGQKIDDDGNIRAGKPETRPWAEFAAWRASYASAPLIGRSLYAYNRLEGIALLAYAYAIANNGETLMLPCLGHVPLSATEERAWCWARLSVEEKCRARRALGYTGVGTAILPSFMV